MDEPESKEDGQTADSKRPEKLGLISGVYIPVSLNILSILMFLRFGTILGQVGFVGIISKSFECTVFVQKILIHSRPVNHRIWNRPPYNIVFICYCLQR